MNALVVSLSLLLAACAPSPAPTPSPDPPRVQGHTGDTGPLPVVDCRTTPGPEVAVEVLDAPRGYHGLAFDQSGRLVGSDSINLVAATSPTEASIFASNIGRVQQLEFLPSGSLVAIAEGALWRFDPGGGQVRLTDAGGAYGMVIDPEGWVFLPLESVIYRVDPETGERRIWYPMQRSVKVVEFSVDYRTLYVGGQGGRIGAIPVTADLVPAGPVRFFAQTPDTFLDGLRMDACGRLYAPVYTTTKLYVFQPDGTPSLVVDYGPGQYGHGLSWGSGIGAWEDHSIYVPQPYNGRTVGKLDLGVPYRTFNGGRFETLTD